MQGTYQSYLSALEASVSKMQSEVVALGESVARRENALCALLGVVPVGREAFEEGGGYKAPHMYPVVRVD
jgi:hypothetical protein